MDEITRVTLADFEFPQVNAVQHVELRRITIPAGAPTGAHTHNGPVFGTIVRGTIRFQVRGQAEQHLNPGDPFYEPAETVIEHFDAGPEGAVFDAWFPLPEGASPVLTLV